MIRRSFLLPTLALAAATAMPVSALDANGLWRHWLDADRAAGGPAISARSVAADGETLVLSGLRIAQGLGDGEIALTIDRMTLQEADEAVIAIIAEGSGVTVDRSPASPAAATRAIFTLTDGDLTLTATGPQDAPDYAIAAPAVGLVLDRLETGGSPRDADFALAFDRLTGAVTVLPEGAGAPLTADLAADGMTYSVALASDDGADRVATAATQDAIEIAARFDPGTPASDGTDDGTDAADTATNPGWSARTEFRSGPARSTTRQTGPNGRASADTRQARTAATLDMVPGRADYRVQLTGLDSTLTGSELPVSPITLGAGLVDLDVSVPTVEADTPQELRLVTELRGVTASENLWALIDLGGRFPRTPADLSLDLGADVMVADMVGGMDGDAPGMLPQAVRVNRFTLDFADAALEADGEVTLHGADGASAPDLSRPAGRLNLSARGLPGLIDRLSDAGVLRPEQTLGVQMMLGMFATQGQDGELTSDIIAEPGGGLVINGTRLR